MAPSPNDRYGSDVLAADWRTPTNGRAVEIDADLGLVVEEVTTDWCGEIVKVERDLGTVILEDRRNKRRTFPLGPGFMLEGRPVVLVAPTRKGTVAPTSRSTVRASPTSPQLYRVRSCASSTSRAVW